MSSRTIRLAALPAILLLSTGAFAQDAEPDTGFYLGAGLTQSRFDNDDFDVDDIDNEDNSWKVILGARPHRNFAFEANYVNFGKSTQPSVPAGGPFEADADGYALFALGIAPIGPIELYGKLGVSRIDSDGNVGAVFFKDKATQLAYGAGIQFRLGGLGLRVEYEKYDTDVIGDLDLITAGVTYTFGSH
ncbi:MAG: outer membrane beta-barrel protein [Pseudomonadota bacterium]